MNLLSVAKITDHEYNVKLDKHGWSYIVYRNRNGIKMTAVRKCILREIFNSKEAAVIENINIRHKRLRYANRD